MENEERILNDEAAALKKAFDDLEFAVLYFNSLSSESIATLLEALSKADHSQLLMIALVFLSKGKTAKLYDADGVPYEDVFHHFSRCPTPLIFFLDLAVDGTQKEKSSSITDDENDSALSDIYVNDSALDDVLAQNESNLIVAGTHNENDFNLHLLNCPPNSLVLAARHNSTSSPVVREFTEKLSHTSVQECFKAICRNNNNGTTVKSMWHDTVGNKFFIVKSINDR